MVPSFFHSVLLGGSAIALIRWGNIISVLFPCHIFAHVGLCTFTITARPIGLLLNTTVIYLDLALQFIVLRLQKNDKAFGRLRSRNHGSILVLTTHP